MSKFRKTGSVLTKKKKKEILKFPMRIYAVLVAILHHIANDPTIEQDGSEPDIGCFVWFMNGLKNHLQPFIFDICL